ncbi:Respiration factor 2 [Fusarium oxysporum f. sp. cubense]|nr:Respiration factor 2 [Fusarium oxysporum f. sp. cubense]
MHLVQNTAFKEGPATSLPPPPANIFCGALQGHTFDIANLGSPSSSFFSPQILDLYLSSTKVYRTPGHSVLLRRTILNTTTIVTSFASAKNSMDGPRHPSNCIKTTSSGHTYPSPTAISSNQLQTGSPLPQALPPLQPPTSAMQNMYGSHPHAPRTPGSPNTPGSASNMPSYQQQTSQPTSRAGLYSMAQNQYPPPQSYGTSAMMPQANTAASHPQPIAPAPAGGRDPHVLHRMPLGGIMSQPGVSSPYDPGSLMQPTAVMPEGEPPTHVVGSQGRRGILPSAPGRPAAPAAGTGAKNTVIPVKDADGKFPCPHCTKTYLHVKHLKRHLLRHTGDRPYMCVLCRDTFSRSDILKRHFQKCSIRHGNPTGVSHLSDPQAHIKKNQRQAQKAAGLGHEGHLNHFNGLSNLPADNMVHPFGMTTVSGAMNEMAQDQSQRSQVNSLGPAASRYGTPPDMVGGSIYHCEPTEPSLEP